jgi:rhodanese-related sulfurtransferase
VTVAGGNRRHRVIPRAEVEDRLENDSGLAVVEVSDAPDFAAGHLPGAVLAPLDWRFDATMLEQLPTLDQTVVVYGRGSDGEAAAAADRLADLGYREVLHYDGGKRDWRAAGQPLEGGS